MLKWALISAFVSTFAGILGFSGLAGDFTDVAQVLFMAALSAFLLFMFLGLYMIDEVAD